MHTFCRSGAFGPYELLKPAQRCIAHREIGVVVTTDRLDSLLGEFYLAIELHDQAFPSVRVKEVTVNAWPLAKLVLSTVISPPPPVAVTVPCAWQVVPSLA